MYDNDDNGKGGCDGDDGDDDDEGKFLLEWVLMNPSLMGHSVTWCVSGGRNRNYHHGFTKGAQTLGACVVWEGCERCTF